MLKPLPSYEWLTKLPVKRVGSKNWRLFLKRILSIDNIFNTAEVKNSLETLKRLNVLPKYIYKISVSLDQTI